MPELDDMIAELTASGEGGFGHLPGYDEYAAAVRKFMETNSGTFGGAKSKTYLDPSKLSVSDWDPLGFERAVWRDRLKVMQHSSVSPDKTIKGHVEVFLADKKADADAGLITVGRVNKLRIQLKHFQEWLGQETPVTDIDSSTLIGYRAEILKKVEANSWTRTTAHERMGTAKSFVRWLFQIEAIASLPRVLGGNSNVLEIGKSRSKIVVFTME